MVDSLARITTHPDDPAHRDTCAAAAGTTRRLWLALAGVLCFYAVLFGRSAAFEFVWDDVSHIVNNPLFDRPLAQGLSVSQTAHATPEELSVRTAVLAYDSYRPLLFLSYWVDIALFGRSAAAMHVHNLLLGGLCIVLLFSFLSRSLGNVLAIGVTALFALHPLQVEPICYVSARGDVLAGLLAIASATLLLQAHAQGAAGGPRRWLTATWLALAAVAFMGSLLAKESYLALPVALAALAWATGRLRRWAGGLGLLAATAGAYLALRLAVIGQDAGAVGTEKLSHAAWQFPAQALQYVRMIFLPVDMSTERLGQGGLEVTGWVAGGLLVLALAFALLRLRGAARSAVALAIAGLVWFLVLLAPASVVATDTGVLADRYAYLPLGGAGMAIGGPLQHLWRQLPRWRYPIGAVIAILGALALVVSFVQVPTWRNNATLYGHAAAIVPQSSMAQYRLGYQLARQQRWAEAVERFQRAIELDPKNVRAHNNLGVAWMNLGQQRAAQRVLRRGLSISAATNFRGWFNLGVSYRLSGEDQQACNAFARAVRINPGYAAGRHEWQRCTTTPARR